MFDRPLSFLATAATRRPWLVVAAWVLLFALGAWQAKDLEGLLHGSVGAIPGTDAARVEAMLAKDFRSPYAQFLVVTLEPAGATRDVTPVAAALESRLRAAPEVADLLRVPGARAGHAALVVGLTAPDVKAAEAAVAPLSRVVAEATAGASARVHLTGQAPLSLELVGFGTQEAARAERLVLPVTFLALLVAFGAIAAAGLPVVVGVAAAIVAMGAFTVFAREMPLSVYASNVISMLGLGLGIDYALFMVARIREEARRGLPHREAVATALARAGGPLVFSALTVLIGLLALALLPSQETRGMGLGGALVAGVSLLAGLTLLPALAALLGPRLEWPLALSRRLASGAGEQRAEALARRVIRKPWPALALSGALLVAMALPVAGLKLGDPEAKLLPQGLGAIQAVGALERMGISGALVPVTLVVESPDGQPLLTPARLRGLAALTDQLREDARVERVIALADREAGASRLLAGAALLGPEALARRLEGPARSLLDEGLTATAVTVVLRNGISYEAARAYAHELKAIAAPAGLEGARLSVGGPLAVANDLVDLTRRGFPLVFAVVVVATLLMLFVMTRSVLIPLKAVLANTLTVAAALGGTLALFGSDWGSRLLGLAEPVATFSPGVPLIAFCVVFGLSMDYEVFMVSRMLERHRAGDDTETAIARGLAASAGVITSGATIMALVFLGFALTDFVPVKMLGCALFLGVLLDATVTRLVFVPAMMAVAGRWNWWPGRARVSP